MGHSEIKCINSFLNAIDLWRTRGYCPAFFKVRILIVGAEKSMQNGVTAAALTLPDGEMDFFGADSPAGGKQCNKREGRGTDARLGWAQAGDCVFETVFCRSGGTGEEKSAGSRKPGKGFVWTWVWPKANPQRDSGDWGGRSTEDLGSGSGGRLLYCWEHQQESS